MGTTCTSIANPQKKSNNKAVIDNKFENAERGTLFLIFGFIRMLEIIQQIIPTEIIQIICKYYHYKLFIIYLQQNGDYKTTKPPIIRISEFENKTNYKCIMKPLDDSYGDIKHQMDAGNAVCYVKDFQIPSKMLSFYDTLYDNQPYDAIFSLSTGLERKEGICYIIDPLNIGTSDDLNIYYWQLPKAATRDLAHSFSLYSSKYGLICIGHSLNILNFDEETNLNEWKWETNTIPHHEDGSTNKGIALSATMITENKLFCCGGVHREQMSDIYDFNSKEWTKLADMNHVRSCSGICFDDSTNKKVFIGGGASGTHKKFEYYEIGKNQWISLSDTNEEHKAFSIIWIENVNIINIASTWSTTFEQMDIRQNKWHSYIQNKGKKAVNDLFGVRITNKIGTNRLCMCHQTKKVHY